MTDVVEDLQSLRLEDLLTVLRRAFEQVNVHYADPVGLPRGEMSVSARLLAIKKLLEG